jgi:DNA-binding NtrC family response regulator
MFEGMALSDLGDALAAISKLTAVVEMSPLGPDDLRFAAAFALFVRKADFQAPEEALPALTQLRQLATSLGDARSLAGLHLAVARLEGCRGHCVDAHRHLEIAKRFVDRSQNLTLQCILDIVEASLESIAGNIHRSRAISEGCLERASRGSLQKYIVGSAAMLGVVATSTGNSAPARAYFDSVLRLGDDVVYMKLGALDNLAQIALHDDDLEECQRRLDECAAVIARTRVPARSWYDLAHQQTRCAYLERRGHWQQIVETVDDVDPELGRRQFKAVRTALLCAKARALSRMDRHDRADAVLATAMRICPRGAVDPLIVLEASKAFCMTAKGDRASGALHFDRALAACRAIGHRYHERWIARDRESLAATRPASSDPVAPRNLDLTGAALLLSDVAAVLGAGHSMDLLAHRITAILESTTLGARLHVQHEAGLDYRPEPSASWETSADGLVRIQLRGSDRLVTIEVREVHAIDEVSLLKSLVDVILAAVNRTADAEVDADDQNLWPRSLPAGGDTVFASPRMIELTRIAERLAATEIPILLRGETGTGKEIFARLIHDSSRARRGPFVAFNCSAIPKELVESQLFGYRRGSFTGASESFPGVIRAAEGGTLFLDEIGDLDPTIQPKLLRFLEASEIHPVGELKPQRVAVRIIAATNADLDDLARQGTFRRDLFYRLGVAPLVLPPLRERKDEIPALASLFLTRYAQECRRTGVRLGDDLMAALLLYDWPGNIRQLSNEIRRVVAMAADGQTLGVAALSPEILSVWNTRPTVPTTEPGDAISITLGQTLDQATAKLERAFIERAMTVAGGRVAEAAQLLGISRKGLFLKRRRQGLVGR